MVVMAVIVVAVELLAVAMVVMAVTQWLVTRFKRSLLEGVYPAWEVIYGGGDSGID